MENIIGKIQGHYHRSSIYEDILRRLEEKGVDLKNVKRSDISSVDEFHVRGAAVSKELAGKINLSKAKVLDVGCGLGGPCRLLADEYKCDVTGIDLTLEYILTAQKLSELVGLKNRTKFLQADALDLPFLDNSFDAVWTQHVQMNIENKTRFYSEIKRVLRDGGKFIYYDIFKKGEEQITYPVPWAEDASMSFLWPHEKVKKLLAELELNQIYISDETDAGIRFFENVLARIKEHGPPILGLNVLMGDSTFMKINNLLNALKGGKIELKSGVWE